MNGKIIDIKTENECPRYVVTHMEKKGINWYWPEKINVLMYEKDEIVRKIPEPVPINKRGLYVINEISEFAV